MSNPRGPSAVSVLAVGGDPDVLAREIADDLQTALDQFASIAAELKE